MATIVQVVGSATATTGGDDLITARLVAAGHTVTLRSDEDAVLADTAHDGFVICPSCSSGTVTNKYATSTKPGMVLDEAVVDDHNMVGAITAASVTQWVVTESGALDAGLTGTVTVYTTATTQNGATISGLGSGAVVVATRAGASTAATYFYYPSGSSLIGGGAAPNRRVGFLIANGAEANLNSNALALFDAAIAYAFTSAAAPTVGAGADVASHPVSTAFTRTATESANGATITSRAWTIVSGPTGVGTTIGTAAALSWTPGTVGTYVLRYSATNSVGTGTDDMQIVVASASTITRTRTVLDDFNDGTIGAAWTNWGTPQTSESGGLLRITSTTAAGYYGLDYVTTLGIDEAHVGTFLTSAGNQALASLSVYPVLAALDATHEFYWAISGNQGRCQSNNAGVYTTHGAALAYNSSVHRYFAVGERGGQLEWLWSTDGSAWTVHASVANPFGALPLTAEVTLLVGTDAAEASTTVATYDELFRLTATGAPTVGAGADATHTLGTPFTRTATETGSGITARAWTIQSGPAGAGTTIGTAAALSWTPGSSGSTSIREPVYQETAYRITSTAENSTTDWESAYSYIEDYLDNRGYTAGLVGFTTATDDLRQLVVRYAALKPSGNTLSPYLSALQTLSNEGMGPNAGARAAELLGAPFISAWVTAAAAEPLFRQAQRELRQELYFGPALEAAVVDGVGPLGLALYYDTFVNHGPGVANSNDGSFTDIRSRTTGTRPSSGGNQTTWLNNWLSVRSAVLTAWGDNPANGRISMFQTFVSGGNLSLTTPFSWSIYGDNFTISSPPVPPADSVTGTYVLRYSATNPSGTGTDDVQLVVNSAAPAGGGAQARTRGFLAFL